MQSLGFCFYPHLKRLKRFIVLLPDTAVRIAEDLRTRAGLSLSYDAAGRREYGGDQIFIRKSASRARKQALIPREVVSSFAIRDSLAVCAVPRVFGDDGKGGCWVSRAWCERRAGAVTAALAACVSYSRKGILSRNYPRKFEGCEE
jgi:hypothetical protein